MARLARNHRLETRTAREKLKVAHEPYWMSIHSGLQIGYRKGERGGIWYMRRREGRRYIKHRIGQADDIRDSDNLTVFSFAEAQKLAISWAEAASTGLSPSFDPNYKVSDATHDYLETAKLNQKSFERTQQTVNAHILEPLGDIRVSELSTSAIQTWRQNLVSKARRNEKQKPDLSDPETLRRRKATADRIFTVLKAALNYAYRAGKIESNTAWHRIGRFKGTDAPKIEHLTPEQCQALLTACPDDAFRDLAYAALLTGARYGELISLKCKDFNPMQRTIYIADSKSGKPRDLGLNEEGVRHFRNLTDSRASDELILLRGDGSPWGRNHQQRPMRKACDAAGIKPPVSFHVLRHTYASLLAMSGMQSLPLAKALGHADTRTTERHYAHLQPSHVHDQIRQHLPLMYDRTGNLTASTKMYEGLIHPTSLEISVLRDELILKISEKFDFWNLARHYGVYFQNGGLFIRETTTKDDERRLGKEGRRLFCLFAICTALVEDKAKSDEELYELYGAYNYYIKLCFGDAETISASMREKATMKKGRSGPLKSALSELLDDPSKNWKEIFSDVQNSIDIGHSIFLNIDWENELVTYKSTSGPKDVGFKHVRTLISELRKNE